MDTNTGLVMVVNVLNIATNKKELMTLEQVHVPADGSLFMLGKIKDSHMWAELEIQCPERGWKMFPN